MQKKQNIKGIKKIENKTETEAEQKSYQMECHISIYHEQIPERKVM